MELRLSDHELLYKGLDMYYHIQSLHSPRNMRELQPRHISHVQTTVLTCVAYSAD